jgi:hypothetical protein
MFHRLRKVFMASVIASVDTPFSTFTERLSCDRYEIRGYLNDLDGIQFDFECFIPLTFSDKLSP